MRKVEIWASGSGSNAEQLVAYFNNHSSIQVSLIRCNKSNAGVVERAKRLGIPCEIMSMEQLNGGTVLSEMLSAGTDFVVLAGFLKLIPPSIVQQFQNRIINVHPALLPAYGGKDMYGNNVHQAVLAAKEPSTGISIHLVNEKFDEGRVLAQFSTAIDLDETLESLLVKIRRLEHKFFPIIVEDYILNY